MNLALIAQGVIGGLAVSLSGLANKDKRENFDWKKMTSTLVVSGVIGGIAGATGQDYGMVANSGLAAGVTVVVEKTWKSIYRKFIK